MNVKFRNALFGLGLGVAAFSTAALSLGSARGTVVLGRPIDLVFEVQVDAGTELDGACTVADMVSGETPIASERIRITPLPAVPGRTPAVRVQSAVVADEPVLTVKLAVGCAGKITRTYIFLAELPESVVATSAPIAIPMAVPVRAALVDARSGSDRSATSQGSPDGLSGKSKSVAAGSSAAPVQAPPRAVRVQRARDKPAAPAVSKPVQSRPQKPVKPPPQPPKPSQARLVMEPLEAWKEPPSGLLRPSTELAAPQASGSESERAQAAALWKTLNAQPQEVLQDSARMQALDAQLASMRSQAASDRAATLEVQRRLEKMEAERYPASVVYGLFLLLLATLAWAAWMVLRVRALSARARQTWNDSVARIALGDTLLPETASTDSHAEVSSLVAGDTAAQDAAVFAPVPVVAVAQPSTEAAVQAPAVHVIHPEELFDLQQQAEFFVSVGEHDHAINVLKKHIASNERISPLAYLELLRLYRSLSRMEEFIALRAQFQQYFNAQVPEFSAFSQQGRTLADYPDTLAQIEGQWADPAILPLIENLLFCRTDSPIERFDLAAYDDLLLLYAIARTTAASARGTPPLLRKPG